MVVLKWVVGVSDAHSWTPFPGSETFDEASGALDWVEAYLKTHPGMFQHDEIRGFTCKRVPLSTLGLEPGDESCLDVKPEAAASLASSLVSYVAPQTRSRSSLMSLVDL